MIFLVFGFTHSVWVSLADDVSEFLVGSFFTGRVKLRMIVSNEFLYATNIFKFGGPLRLAATNTVVAKPLGSHSSGLIQSYSHAFFS